MSDSRPTVLILGAGINGCALARELLLNGVSVVLVDKADLCAGATAYASRLIHGGLRYLEYGEFDLVRESLAERTRLLRLAPQFVRPLRLFIPTGTRLSGLVSAAGRFFGWRQDDGPSPPRGAWLIRAGLTLYDFYAHDGTVPKHRTHRATDAEAVPVDTARYRWECAYSDAQIEYPERFVLALLEDARAIARDSKCEFHLFTYHEATRIGTNIEIRKHRPAHASDFSDPAHSSHSSSPFVAEPTDSVVQRFEPAAIINATGAWVDLTLAELQLPAQPLMAGTKGSHLFTFHDGLRRMLAGRGLYAEAADGRPIFITPLAEATLIGTTDLPFPDCPAKAVASPEEIEYLISAVNRILPQVGLMAGDIAFHYSGVRPLPRTDGARPAAVTRRHWLEHHPDAPLPTFSIIGGKLTTCRSLAESAARTILAQLGLPAGRNSEDRLIPGAENYPRDPAALTAVWDCLATQFGLPREAIQAVWSLVGTRTAGLLEPSADQASELLPDTFLPCSFVRSVIRHEWVTSLGDLVERRLMLLFQPRLSEACLRRLAELLAEAGMLPASRVDVEIRATVERLRSRFGKSVEPPN